MKVKVNGEDHDLLEGISLTGLVDYLGAKNSRVAVELNLEIVPKARFDETRLSAGDIIEVVGFVGGGLSLSHRSLVCARVFSAQFGLGSPVLDLPFCWCCRYR